MRPFERAPAVNRKERGDTAVILVFLILTVIVLSATVLAALSVGSLRGVQDVLPSTRALYAADTGVERLQNEFFWDVLSPSNPAPSCPDYSSADQPVAGLDTVLLSYTGKVEAKPKGCAEYATTEALIEAVGLGETALCIEARGKARGGAVQRRVTNDSYAPSLNDPCGRGG